MHKLSPALARMLLVLVLLGLWEIFTRLSSVSAILIAPPSAILWQMVRILVRASNVPDFYANAGLTIVEILIAYGLAAVFGVLAGIAVASSKVIGDAFEPILLVLYAVPKIILYPVIVLMIGTGPATKIIFGVFVGIFVIIFNTAAGLRHVEPNYVRLAHSLGYGAPKIFFKVQLPAAARTILAGLRLGFGYTIIGVLTGELLLVNAGLGYLIDWASVNYYTAQLYALIVITLAIGVVANYVVGQFERRWVKRMSARQRKYLPLAIRLAAIAIFIAIWDLAVGLCWIDPLFLATPLDTIDHLVPVTIHAAPDLAITLTAFLSAFVAGVFFALAIGFAIGLSNYSRKMLLPLLVLGVTIPKVTLLPLFILWFGIALTPVIVFGALSGFFPMVINVMTAGGEVKPNQVLLAKAMGFGPLQIFRKVTLPAMLPVLVSGLFYACNASMMGVFIVELALARHGLGAVVHDLAVTFQTADMYAAVLLTASITVAINMALWYAARYFGRWRY